MIIEGVGPGLDDRDGADDSDLAQVFNFDLLGNGGVGIGGESERRRFSNV